MLNIAINTFREIVRNKFFGLIAFLGIILILISLVLDTLALGESKRVLFDFGLSFIELTGVAIVLFLGGGMIAREIEGRTIYLILSKPIPRRSLVFGKFLGFFAIVTLILSVESILLVGTLFLKGFLPDVIFVFALFGIFLKILALLALILFFSTFLSPMVALFMTLASYIIGHSGYVMLEYALQNNDAFLWWVAKWVLIIFPNFSAINVKNLVATGAVFDVGATFGAFGLALLYIFVVLILAGVLFEKKSFDAA